MKALGWVALGLCLVVPAVCAVIVWGALAISGKGMWR